MSGYILKEGYVFNAKKRGRRSERQLSELVRIYLGYLFSHKATSAEITEKLPALIRDLPHLTNEEAQYYSITAVTPLNSLNGSRAALKNRFISILKRLAKTGMISITRFSASGVFASSTQVAGMFTSLYIKKTPSTACF